jgi:AcrR family transcriptional regulator
MQPVGLRELKKSQTRQLIADTAAELFRHHGFDTVTVETVAQVAGVSKKTVFNYFPTKEDLVFDRAEDRAGALLAAVHERPAGTSVLESFRRLCLDQVTNLPRLREAAAADHVGFLELVRSNPSLQRKMHEVHGQLTHQLAVALAEEAGTDADDPVATVVAGALIGAQRTLYLRLRERAAGPDSDPVIARQHRRDTNRVFDRLRDGLAGYPTRGRASGRARATRSAG